MRQHGLTALLVVLVAGACGADRAAAPAPCVSETCAFSTNLPFDSAGTPDTRPGTWGNADVRDVPYVFQGVPTGYRVRVLRVYGDFIAWPRGQIASGQAAGTLFGILTPSAAQSPYAGPGLGAAGCLVYIQQGVGPWPARAPFDFRVGVGLLDADNTMIVRDALFLNDTNTTIHMEATFVIEFRYERLRQKEEP